MNERLTKIAASKVVCRRSPKDRLCPIDSNGATQDRLKVTYGQAVTTAVSATCEVRPTEGGGRPALSEASWHAVPTKESRSVCTTVGLALRGTSAFTVL